MASMAAAAYYQQLSMSLGGNPGMTPNPFFHQNDIHSPSQIAAAAALASNPYLFNSPSSPPCAAAVAQVSSIRPPNSMGQMAPLQRYHSLPEQLQSLDSPFNHLNRQNNPVKSHGIPLVTQSLQNGTLLHQEMFDGNVVSDKYNHGSSRRHSQQTQVHPENVLWTTNYSSLPATAWNVNHLYNLRKGNLTIFNR